LFHVDGTFNAEQRNEKLNWLKDEADENICRVLTNARCLSEGVDVPALDAIMFLHPRKSQIDVVQSVGRVMRKSEGKEFRICNLTHHRCAWRFCRKSTQ